MKKYSLLVLAVLFCATSLFAGFIPYGVQNDVSLETVLTDWEWEIVYRNNYSDGGTGDDLIPFTEIFDGVSANDYIMLASIEDGSETIDVLSAAQYSDITTVTQRNQTHLANGAEWYYNIYSMGFAGEGDIINQNTADIEEYSERDRLSWHTDQRYTSGGLEPTGILFGWRSGDNLNLNQRSDWDRLVLRYSPVPEPSVLSLLAFGLLGLGFIRKKRS